MNLAWMMITRECREDDLGLLERHNLSPGQTRRHEERFRRQQQGWGTFLTFLRCKRRQARRGAVLHRDGPADLGMPAPRRTR